MPRPRRPPMVRRVQTHHVVDESARVRPEPQRPPRQHAALAVAEHVDLAVGAGAHRPQRVDHVLPGNLDIAGRMLGQADRAPGPVLRVESPLVVPVEVRLGVQRGAWDEQDGRPPSTGDARGALQRRREPAGRDAQRSTGAVQRGTDRCRPSWRAPPESAASTPGPRRRERGRDGAAQRPLRRVDDRSCVRTADSSGRHGNQARTAPAHTARRSSCRSSAAWRPMMPPPGMWERRAGRDREAARPAESVDGLRYERTTEIAVVLTGCTAPGL